MALKENKIKEYFLANASNYIYALISDDDIRNVFNGTQGAVIRRKREYQMAYIINSAQSSNLTYNDIIKIINTGIVNEYGKNGKDVLYQNTEKRTNIRFALFNFIFSFFFFIIFI